MIAESPYVTVDSVRWFLQAGETKSSRLTGEPDFSPDDIVQGMRMAARRYNDLPPTDFVVGYNQLCDDRAFWYDAIAAVLYRVLVRRIQERNLQVNVGDGSVNPVAERIKFLTSEAARMDASSMQAMAEFKNQENIKGGFAFLG